eukprot:2591032-Rhodomonas_salina.2
MRMITATEPKKVKMNTCNETTAVRTQHHAADAQHEGGCYPRRDAGKSGRLVVSENGRLGRRLGAPGAMSVLGSAQHARREQSAP